MDFIPNHSSNEHRWFTESKKKETNKYSDYYIWRDGKSDGVPPNNWVKTKLQLYSLFYISQCFYILCYTLFYYNLYSVVWNVDSKLCHLWKAIVWMILFTSLRAFVLSTLDFSPIHCVTSFEVTIIIDFWILLLSLISFYCLTVYT